MLYRMRDIQMRRKRVSVIRVMSSPETWWTRRFRMSPPRGQFFRIDKVRKVLFWWKVLSYM